MVKIFACGDIVNKAVKPDFISLDLMKRIQDADIAVCNFEAPVQSVGRPILKAGPHLYQAVQTVKYLSDAGFNLFSIANNHIYDYGETGLSSTITEFQNLELNYLGADLDFENAYKSRIIVSGGLKVGFISACEAEFGALTEDEDRGGYAWIFHPKINKEVIKLNEICDYVIFIAHAGAERFHLPLPEWRQRYKELCSLGIDVIIGHHPHVPQGYEVFNESLIFYSLGNFYFDSHNPLSDNEENFSVEIILSKNKPIDFNLIFHKKNGKKVDLISKSDTHINIEELNKNLITNYITDIDDFCESMFNSTYLKYFEIIFLNIGSRFGIKSILRSLLYILVFQSSKIKKKREVLLQHNLKIETHRFITLRALHNRLFSNSENINLSSNHQISRKIK